MTLKHFQIRWPQEWLKRTRLFRTDLLSYSGKDFIVSVSLYLISVVFCLVLRNFDPNNDTSYVSMIFLLDVFLTALLTDGFFFSLTIAVFAVLSVDYIFTPPFWEVSFTLAGFPLTFLVMLIVSVVVSTLTTQIKQQEKIRAEAEKEKMRGNLLRAVSHDIRTPLTSIVGGVSTLLDSGDQLDEATRTQLLENIRDESNWLVSVVENLLSVTRMTGEQTKIKKEMEAGEEVLSAAAMKIKKHYPEITVSVRAPQELLMIPMDVILIEQVLINLMENSIQHGGTTTRVELQLRKEGENARFEVADNGQGIAREVFPKLFKGYLSHDEELTADGRRNMGIGLSVCMSIVQAHGGTMQAENREIGGALFSFTLPLEERNYEDPREDSGN